MALTPSRMLALGTRAPSFELPDVISEQRISFEQLRGVRGTVLMFICNHCPYVQHVNAELVRVARDYAPHGIGIAAISANDATAYPADGPEAMRQAAAKLGYPFPYLYDETQAIARAYDAACTPDFFLFDADAALVYRGRLDDSTPGNGRPLTGADLRAALDAVVERRVPDPQQQASVGCNIKWKRLS